MNKLQLIFVLIAAFIGAFVGAIAMQDARAQTIGNGPANVVYLAPSPSSSPQAGVAFFQGLALTGDVAAPSPQVSSTPFFWLGQTTTGTAHPTNWINYTDVGQSLAGSNAFAFNYNNQGTNVQLATLQRSQTLTLQNGGQIATSGIATPAAPAPTCSPGGANGSVSYFVTVEYVGTSSAITNPRAQSAEGSVTCSANTRLQVAAPTTVAGATGWTVSASTTAGTELEQTQGTAPVTGTNIPFSTSTWVSTDALAGAVAPAANNTTGGAWQETIGGSSWIAFNPYGTSLLHGPLEGSTKPETASATPAPLTFYPLVYKHDGTASASTMHCVGGGGDTVTAAGASTTVTLTAPANFAAATYPLQVWDTGTFTAAVVTAQATGSFTFTSTNTHVYAYWACGA